jgi:hypothetical protein
MELQGAAQTHKGVKILSANRLLEDLKIHRYALRLRKRPWNYLGPCNVVLGLGGGGGSPDSGEAATGEGRGRGRGQLGTRLARLGAEDEVGAAPATAHGGARR